MARSGVGRAWVPITLDNAWFVEFLTEPAGVLRVGPAKVRATFRFVARDRDENDCVAGCTNTGCRNNCRNVGNTCRTKCESTCVTCTTTAGCAAATACATAAK